MVTNVMLWLLALTRKASRFGTNVYRLLSIIKTYIRQKVVENKTYT